MKKSDLTKIIKEELQNILKVKTNEESYFKHTPEVSKLIKVLSKLPEAEQDDIEDITPDQGKALIKILSKVMTKFPELKKDGALEYVYAVFDSGMRGQYTHPYAHTFYDDDKYTKEWTKDVDSYSKIKGIMDLESKTPVREAMDSLASYYTQAGKIGQGEYNLRNVLEELDDILMGLDKTTRYELTTVISDAIDMAYDMGVDEGMEQSK